MTPLTAARCMRSSVTSRLSASRNTTARARALRKRDHGGNRRYPPAALLTIPAFRTERKKAGGISAVTGEQGNSPRAKSARPEVLDAVAAVSSRRRRKDSSSSTGVQASEDRTARASLEDANLGVWNYADDTNATYGRLLRAILSTGSRSFPVESTWPEFAGPQVSKTTRQ
jgi:hypothetical protein